MKMTFVERNFSTASLGMIELVNSILDEYNALGYKLSLRQLYYQLVARGHVENTQRSYKNVGNLVSNARQAGLIDWDMIEDRNRETISLAHWKNPGQIVRAAANQFRIDKWDNQDYHVEVMVEKDALSGVLVPVCRDLDLPITANKGYSSSSTMFEIGRRLYRKGVIRNKKILIIYLGDHDPSGIDMTRDVEDRLWMYSEIKFDVERIALNMDQVQKWNPPENPAKETDARFADYVRKFGVSSWELDAIEPRTLAGLVRKTVLEVRDPEKWDDAVREESRMREELLRFANDYGEYDE